MAYIKSGQNPIRIETNSFKKKCGSSKINKIGCFYAIYSLPVKER